MIRKLLQHAKISCFNEFGPSRHALFREAPSNFNGITLKPGECVLNLSDDFLDRLLHGHLNVGVCCTRCHSTVWSKDTMIAVICMYTQVQKQF